MCSIGIKLAGKTVFRQGTGAYNGIPKRLITEREGGLAISHPLFFTKDPTFLQGFGRGSKEVFLNFGLASFLVGSIFFAHFA